MANLQNPVKAIRAKCLDCSCGNVIEVKFCPVTNCSLYPFRMGRNPYRQPMSEERRRIASENMKKLRSKRKELENGI